MAVVATHSNNRISSKAPFQVSLIEALTGPNAVFTALSSSKMRLVDVDAGIKVIFDGRLMEVTATGEPKGISGSLKMFSLDAPNKVSVRLTFDEALLDNLVTVAGIVSGPGPTGIRTHGAFYNFIGTGVGQTHTLRGSDKADVLEGFGSIKTVEGRGGNDTFWFRGGFDYNGGAGNDTLDLSFVQGKTAVDLEQGMASDGNLSALTSIESFRFGAFDDRFTGDGQANAVWMGAGNDEARTGAGNDSVRAGSGHDKVFTGAGNDVVDLGAGRDVVRAGAGDDFIFLSDHKDKIFGGSGSDTVSGVRFGIETDLVIDLLAEKAFLETFSVSLGLREISGIENVEGTIGDDSIKGDHRANTLEGGKGDDHIEGLGGDDILHGEEGDDLLDGGNGVDVLNGGDGEDTLKGGRDDDVLTGGAGPDVFIWETRFKSGEPSPGEGNDTITDFESGVDRIRIRGSEDVDVKIIRPGNDAVILIDDKDGNPIGSITVEGGSGLSDSQLLPDFFPM